jgi:hypothetical protein
VYLQPGGDRPARESVNPMTQERTEQIITGIITGLTCPISLFFLFWWASGALVVYRIYPLPERWIAGLALSGLGIGLIIDILFLGRLMDRFYFISKKILIPLYLFWSAIALALLMGLPFLNLILGTLAGGYAGRRFHHAAGKQLSPQKTARNTGLFTALVTGGEGLVIGILALQENMGAGILGNFTGGRLAIPTGLIAGAGVAAYCAALIAAQYLLTRAAALLAVKTGPGPYRPEL